MGDLLKPGFKTRKEKAVVDFDQLLIEEVGEDKDGGGVYHTGSDPYTLPLKKLRVHYFFNDNSQHIESFLKNTEVEFRITDGPAWTKAIAQARAFPLTHFLGSLDKEGKYDGYCQRQNLLLHFFGNGIERFYVDMACGLKKDKQIKTEKIYLYRYNNMYFPENNYFNSDPLPIEWLELFESSEFFHQEFEKEEDDNDRLAFTPFCSKKELNYLEQDFKGRWNVRKEALITSKQNN